MTNVLIPFGGRKVRATLNDDLTWGSPVPEVAGLLNSVFSREAYPTGPDGGGVPGNSQLYAVEQLLRAKVSWPKVKPGVKGRVY